MAEEKKEDIKQEAKKTVIEDKAQPKAAAPAQEPPKDTAPAAAAAKPAEEKKETPKKEKPANCAGCNKSIKKKRWYYRNGKFYCSKRCWQTAVEKEKKPAAENPAPAQ